MRGREEKINHKPRSEIHYIYTVHIFYKASWVRDDDDDDGDDNLIVCARSFVVCGCAGGMHIVVYTFTFEFPLECVYIYI